MIYFAQSPSTSLIKIGTSKQLSARLASLAASHGEPLVILGVATGSFPDERELHNKFVDIRVSGEWFYPLPHLLAFINQNTKPWDGTDDVPPFAAVKIASSIYRKAKMVAAHRSMPLAEYLSDLLEKPVERDYLKMVESMQSEHISH
ncbi:MAG: GIY-YIG nuclease family protein [Patescibacteria group bacterium]|nr:GIY-YIG nuclease family protein [Patescibacteria group bacterium]